MDAWDDGTDDPHVSSDLGMHDSRRQYEVAKVANATARQARQRQRQRHGHQQQLFFLYTTTTNNERPAGYGVIEQGLWLAYYTRDLGTCLHTNILDEGAWIEDIGVHTLWLTSFGRFPLFLGSGGLLEGRWTVVDQ